MSVVAKATRADNGAKDVHTLCASRNLFTTEVSSPDETADSTDRLYRYDFNDIFFGHGHRFNIREFEQLLATPPTIRAIPL